MLKRSVVLVALLFVIAAGLSISAVSAQTEAETFIVIANTTNQIPAALLREIRSAGGTVNKSMSGLGLVFVTSANPNFGWQIRSANGVVRSIKMRLIEPERIQMLSSSEAMTLPITPPRMILSITSSGGLMPSMRQSWEAGRRGAGVRVAILDEGVDIDHPDLVDRADPILSKSFLPVKTGIRPLACTSITVHTSRASSPHRIMARVSSVSRQKPEIVAVQVLSRDLGYGTDEQVISGIKYAADIGADVINMSLGSDRLIYVAVAPTRKTPKPAILPR